MAMLSLHSISWNWLRSLAAHGKHLQTGASIRASIILPAILATATVLSGCSDQANDIALPWGENEYLRVHVPDMTGNARQQDSYILEYRGGRSSSGGIRSWFGSRASSSGQRVVMIDAGNYEDMRDVGIAYLRSHGIEQIDELYVTHPHKDHYGGVRALLSSDIKVKRLLMNIPLETTCNREIPWGCDYPHVLETIELAKKKGVEHRELYVDDLSAPELLWQDEGIELTLLFAPRGEHPDLGVVDINDQSMIMRLQTPALRYLLVGDLNRQGGAYLAQRLGDELKADVLQAPHHGAEGAAPDEFLQAVDPDHAIVSSFTSLWCSKRSERIRTFFERNETVARVLGMQGNVMVRHFSDSEPVWVEDRRQHMDCDTYWAQIFAQPVPDLVLSSQAGEILAVMDFAEVVKVSDFTAIRFTGWAMPSDAQWQEFKRFRGAANVDFYVGGLAETLEIGLALLNEETKSIQVYSVTRKDRPDVIQAYQKMFDGLRGIDTNAFRPGFEALIRTDELKTGNYSAWIVVTLDGRVMATRTDQSLQVDTDGANDQSRYVLN
jgi:beta-lactamase superfamily II metal-dependent hydrolase